MKKTKQSSKDKSPLASPPIMIRIEDNLRDELQKLADQDDRKLSEYCRRVLRQHVDQKLKK